MYKVGISMASVVNLSKKAAFITVVLIMYKINLILTKINHGFTTVGYSSKTNGNQYAKKHG